VSKIVTYYFSLASPWTYIGGKRLPGIAKATGAEFAVKPVKGGPMFEATGSLPLPKRPPSRKAYRMVELARWRDYWNLPMNLEPAFFPVDDAQAAHMVIAARQAGQDALALSNVFLACVWEKEANIADRDTLIAAANDAGFDGAALAARIGSDAVEAEYQANTDEAIANQAFGMPWYIYDGLPYWGQDRLDFLERALKG
jgi:2-hydroxychromene-2-carboxylate isomerase